MTTSPRQLLPQQVLGRIRDFIRQHGLRPGDKLPNEREIASQLGVSRNSVREAMKSLETVGAVVRRPKIGSVLQRVDLGIVGEIAQSQMVRSDADLAELQAARRLIEVSILPMVVAQATSDDLKQIRNTIEEMERQVASGGSVVEADQAFHRSLFAATKNHFLMQFGAMLQELIRDPKVIASHNPKRRFETIGDHKGILQAIEDRNLPQAIERLSAHLDIYVREGVIPDASALPRSIKPGKPRFNRALGVKKA